MSLKKTVELLCQAVDGADWNAERANELLQEMLRLCGTATRTELDDALGLIAVRVRRSTIGDGDGVAHVAISGGTLIEKGATPRPLAQALLERLPEVLETARAFADRCLPSEPGDDLWEGVADEDVFTDVDDLPITHAVFRRHLPDDRGGGCSLAYLREWVLPTVAALTRDHEMLARAQDDARLVRAAAALRRSNAQWLEFLLATQLAQPWLVLCTEANRAFELEVDQVASNFVLKGLVADAVLAQGVTGQRNPPDVIDVLRGRAQHSAQGYVQGVFDHYTAAALPFLASGEQVPFEHHVWNEGVPTDVVPIADGRRLLVLGPPTIVRTWNARPVFSALRPSVRVVRELDPTKVRALANGS